MKHLNISSFRSYLNLTAVILSAQELGLLSFASLLNVSYLSGSHAEHGNRTGMSR